jgi:hypothetical protein
MGVDFRKASLHERLGGAAEAIGWGYRPKLPVRTSVGWY